MIEASFRDNRNSLRAARTLPSADAAVVPSPGLLTATDLYLAEREPRDHRLLLRVGLFLLDAVALALPMTWLGGVDRTGLVLVAVAVLVMASTGAYRPRITLSALDEAPATSPGWAWP